MKIKQMYVGYTGLVLVGLKGYFIELADEGVETAEDGLVTTLMNYQNIIFYGKPLDAADELVKLIKKLIKLDSNVKICIMSDCKGNSNALIRRNPNVGYIIRVNINDYNEELLKWFNGADAKLIFDCNSIDEIDTFDMFIKEKELNKNNCFISTKNGELLTELFDKCYLLGINYCPDFKGMLWDKK